jgi:hypothetical protein
MKLRYPKWLKRLVLPFESPDHPLYADPLATQQREIEQERIQNLSDEEIDPDFDEYEQEVLEDIIRAKSNNSDTFKSDD